MTEHISMSRDDIQRLIEDLAKNGEGADRRWALNRLLPDDQLMGLRPPLTFKERDERIIRLLKPLGPNEAKRIFNLCFSSVGRSFYFAPGPTQAEIKAAKPKSPFPLSLTQLYNQYPEARTIPNFNKYWSTARKETETRHQWLKEKKAFLDALRAEQAAAKDGDEGDG